MSSLALPLMVSAPDDDGLHLWDAARGQQIAVLDGHATGAESAAFSPDGRLIVTASEYDGARIWDVSRSAALAGRPGVVLAAALARGIGWRTDHERADLLMKDAPDDLFAEALRQLGRPADDPEIAEIAARLRAPLHPNCYLSPTQFAEKFGLAPPEHAAEGAARADTAAAASEGPSEDAEADSSNEETPASIKPAAASAPGRRHLLGAAPDSPGARLHALGHRPGASRVAPD